MTAQTQDARSMKAVIKDKVVSTSAASVSENRPCNGVHTDEVSCDSRLNRHMMQCNSQRRHSRATS